MAILQAQRIVVSLSAKRRQVPKGSKMLHFTEEVIYKTYQGKDKGKGKYFSVTKHEIVEK